MTEQSRRATVTLRALEGEPLRDAGVRRTVVAAAHAIAERNGVSLLDLTTTPNSLTATLDASRLAAIGFAAELRRITGQWHEAHTGKPHLWGEPTPDPPDDPYNLFSPPPP